MGAALVVLALVIAGLSWFEPWRLWTNHRVDEPIPIPVATVAVQNPSESSGSMDLAPTAPASGEPALPVISLSGPVLLGAGDFISYEHETSGRALLLRLEDGRLIVRLTDLATSDGPDLHVYLSSLPSDAGLHAFDQQDPIDLGELSGNLGNQNYDVPAGLDVAPYISVVIWCQRFAVAFGAAPLDHT